MSQEDVDIVRSIYDAFGRGDVRAMMGLLHPEVEVYQSERLPWGGRYAGAEGVGEFLNRFANAVEPELEPEEIVDDGAGHVVVVGRTRGKARGSGRTFEVRSIHVWTVRNGKAARFEAYADTRKVLEALGDKPAERPTRLPLVADGQLSVQAVCYGRLLGSLACRGLPPPQPLFSSYSSSDFPECLEQKTEYPRRLLF